MDKVGKKLDVLVKQNFTTHFLSMDTHHLTRLYVHICTFDKVYVHNYRQDKIMSNMKSLSE
jgi:hypothetical protein